MRFDRLGGGVSELRDWQVSKEQLQRRAERRRADGDQSSPKESPKDADPA